MVEGHSEEEALGFRRVVHASRVDTTLDVPRELFAKNQVLGTHRAGRAQERYDQPQKVRGYTEIYPTDAVAHVANPAFVAARVNAFLGGRLDEKSMIAAVEPALRNQGATRSPASA